jgi:hypothetical protein
MGACGVGGTGSADGTHAGGGGTGAAEGTDERGGGADTEATANCAAMAIAASSSWGEQLSALAVVLALVGVSVAVAGSSVVGSAGAGDAMLAASLWPLGGSVNASFVARFAPSSMEGTQAEVACGEG